ncbi:hypothetical protein EIP86_003505 [Pleurotus ostreatoroseus]|nr:hypothetical protein EIP86_003505 [Pleurotus ostreatoroseus]
MGNLWDDCLSGTLKDTDLRNYLRAGTLIDTPNPAKPFLTPLAAACSRGHLDTVVLLLNNSWSRPDVNKPSLRNRRPLHYTLLDSPPANRAAIVRILLDASADIEATDDQGNTPLILAVGARDTNAVKLLVERKASKTASNNRGATPLSLAKGTPMEALLKSSGLGASVRTLAAAVVNAILSAILLIITYVNKNLLRRGGDANPTGAPQSDTGNLPGNAPGVTGNTPKELYNFSGDKGPLPDPEVAKELPLTDPKTPAEFNKMIDSWLEESELKTFFPDGDRFLQTLAEKAATLRADKNDPLSSQENIKRLTQLSLYQPIIYCDDSGSMRQNSRYEIQKDLVKRIARIATRIVPDDIGVDVRFINADFNKTNLNLDEVNQALTDNGPTGPATRIGSALQDKILKPFVYSYLPTKTLQRPLLVCVITDGSPTAEPQETFKNAIVECRRMVADADYPPDAVRFLVSQIGDDAAAKVFLQALNADRDINDVLHCTTDRLDAEFMKMRQNEDQLESWLLGVLVSPIMNRE